MPAVNPLFEREWRERFRRLPSYLQLGGLVLLLLSLVCLGVWRARFDPDLTVIQWRRDGRALLDIYRWAGGLLFWCGALLMGATSVSDEKSGATWEHLLLCPVGGRGLSVGKIASGAAFLVVLQLALLPVLLVAGLCFGASPFEIGGVMLSHLLLTIQGATLGFWGALRGQTLAEGLVESLGGIGRLVGQCVLMAIIGLCFVSVGGLVLRVVFLLPIPGLGAFLGSVWLFALHGIVLLSCWALSLVAGITGVGVPLLSSPEIGPWLVPIGILVGQLLGIVLFLKWSAWEIDYPTRDFWPASSNVDSNSRGFTPSAPLPNRPTAIRSSRLDQLRLNPFRPTPARSASVRPDPPRPDPARPMPARSSNPRVPAPFGELPTSQTAPPLFGASGSRAEKPRPLIVPPPAPTQPLLPASRPARPPVETPQSAHNTPFLNAAPRHPTSVQSAPVELQTTGAQSVPVIGEQPSPFGPSSAPAPFPFDLNQTRRIALSTALLPMMWQVLYRTWSWTLSPAQLAVFPAKERRESLSKTSNLLPTWEETFAPAPSPDEAQHEPKKNTHRMRAPVSRRWQELNPVLWLDLTRCLSLRSPDSNMVPVLFILGALGGSLLLSITLFLLVGWVQNSLGGSRGDVSSLSETWGDLHWILWWGALACGPIYGATGYVIERRTGMLAELRLTLIDARAMWWGKFLSRFLIPALLSLPLLALVAFFAWNWPDKNGVYEVASALLSSWALSAWSLLLCLWVSDSSRKELSATLWCGAFALAWGVLLWNFPTFGWTPVHLLGATLAGGHLFWRLKRLGFG